MGWEQSLEGEENKKVGEEVSLWSNGGVIRNHVTTKLYILIRDNSHAPYLPLGQRARCFNNSCCIITLVRCYPVPIYMYLFV